MLHRFRTRSTIGVRATRKLKLMPGVATPVKITARLPQQLRQLDHIMELNKKYGELGTHMCIVNFKMNDAHIMLTNPSNKPLFIGTTSILGCLKLKNLCNPWFAIQTNHSEWTSPPSETCFVAKDAKSEPTERHIGFREMTRENLPEFYADDTECIDNRYITSKPNQVNKNEQGELRKKISCCTHFWKTTIKNWT